MAERIKPHRYPQGIPGCELGAVAPAMTGRDERARDGAAIDVLSQGEAVTTYDGFVKLTGGPAFSCASAPLRARAQCCRRSAMPPPQHDGRAIPHGFPSRERRCCVLSGLRLPDRERLRKRPFESTCSRGAPRRQRNPRWSCVPRDQRSCGAPHWSPFHRRSRSSKARRAPITRAGINERS